jgi:ubiquinone/menaquinone biosynthesis C-methylase UbiE
MQPPAPDFGHIAARYDELRPVDELWQQLFETLVREGGLVARRVLEVGCGTGALAGALAERGARVWGIDAEPEMLAVARQRVPAGVGLKEGRAEALPFKDGWFDRVVMRLSLHLFDRPAAITEARRVLGRDGRLVVATFDSSHFDGFWLNGIYPRIAEIDRTRFPTLAQIEADAAAAGFSAVRATRLSQRRPLARAAALERIRGRYISTLQLLDPADYAEGLARAERELPDEIDVRLEWLIVVAEAG